MQRTIIRKKVPKRPTASKPKKKAFKKVSREDILLRAAERRNRASLVMSKAKKPVKKPAVSVVKTKGGDYPVYKKKSSAAQSFRSAFAAARKSGEKVFTWKGRKYTTKTK